MNIELLRDRPDGKKRWSRMTLDLRTISERVVEIRAIPQPLTFGVYEALGRMNLEDGMWWPDRTCESVFKFGGAVTADSPDGLLVAIAATSMRVMPIPAAG